MVDCRPSCHASRRGVPPRPRAIAVLFGRAARARRREGLPMNITLAMLAAPVALIATALPAQEQAGDIADKIINNPNPQAFQVFNAPEPARVVADKTVQGGHALRVKIPGADAKAWTISLSDPIDRKSTRLNSSH